MVDQVAVKQSVVFGTSTDAACCTVHVSFLFYISLQVKACLPIQFVSTDICFSPPTGSELKQLRLPCPTHHMFFNKYYFEAALPKRFIRYLCIDYEAAMPYPIYCRMCTEFHYLLIICLYSGKQDALTNMVP